MNDEAPIPLHAPADERPHDPTAMRLRGDPPRVTRLSRKVIAGLAIVATAGVGGAVIFALQPKTPKAPPQELLDPATHAPAETVSALPKDYTEVPRLGPPLPGDLGRPILSARDRGQPVPEVGKMPTPGTAENPVDQRRQQALEAARTSRVFFGREATAQPSPAPIPDLMVAPPASTAAAAPDRQHAFLAGGGTKPTVSSERISPPASPYILQAGAIIPAALVTGIRSDLPGQITAQVTENVYDSPTGRHLLIPPGARLIGEYDNGVEFGQRRVLLVWNRLIYPDGRSISLDRLPSADNQGFAGLEDGIDEHWGGIAKAALLSTVLGVGAEASIGGQDSIARAIQNGMTGTINDAGQQIVRRQLSVQPTLTIRPGFPMRVIVTHDLMLEPEGGPSWRN